MIFKEFHKHAKKIKRMSPNKQNKITKGNKRKESIHDAGNLVGTILGTCGSSFLNVLVK